MSVKVRFEIPSNCCETCKNQEWGLFLPQPVYARNQVKKINQVNC